MRLVVTSDLHYSPRHQRAVDAFVATVAALSPDLFVIAGDVAEGPEAFDACLARFAALGCPRAVLAGNHDVWSRVNRGGPGSRDLFEQVLPEIAGRHGFSWLETATLFVGRTAVVGSLAWYDYSAADPRIPCNSEEYARRKGEVNADAWYVDWAEDDPAVAARLGDGLVARLLAAAARPDVAEVVVVTHVPLFEACMVRRAPHEPDSHRWNFGNAYFGNLTLGARVAAVDKVRHVVSGHTHFGGDWTVARPGAAPLRTLVVASDYNEPAPVMLEL
jgi:3',5'-cyclic AMP phosphodiesterase CpdA